MKKQMENMFVPGEQKWSKMTITGSHNHTSLDLVSGRCEVEGQTHITPEDQNDQQGDTSSEGEQPNDAVAKTKNEAYADIDSAAMLLVGVGAFAG